MVDYAHASPHSVGNSERHELLAVTRSSDNHEALRDELCGSQAPTSGFQPPEQYVRLRGMLIGREARENMQEYVDVHGGT